MKETERQQYVTKSILNQETGQIKATTTESGFTVIITAGGEEAAYEADQARELADAIEEEDGFEEDPTPLANYIRELADVVENSITKQELQDEWEDVDLNEPDS
jgi:hypothetical protein